MDRVLVERGGVSRVRVSGAVLIAHMAPGRADEPVPRVHRNDQLWTLPAPQDPIRPGEDVPPGSASPAGAADPARGVLRARRVVLESPRTALPEAQAVLRPETGREVCAELARFCGMRVLKFGGSSPATPARTRDVGRVWRATIRR